MAGHLLLCLLLLFFFVLSFPLVCLSLNEPDGGNISYEMRFLCGERSDSPFLEREAYT
ncbi:hypothetical protein LZ32DRAFT_603683 [Colletotrichum eremochloae]|nr:hypothetical protein LZ32DRAFT_603683 [Colletotrichum eremochloae]